MSGFGSLGWGDRGQQVVLSRSRGKRPWGKTHFEVSSLGATAIALAAVLGVSGVARAENECGALSDGDNTITCSSSNYTKGSIIYRLTQAHGDINFQFMDGLSITYDLGDTDDDHVNFSPRPPFNGDPLYSAVRIETDENYEGNISLTSEADVTSNGRGISVVHGGKSGTLTTTISDSAFSINNSTWSLPHAIHSSQGGSGDNNLIVDNIDITSKVSPNVAWGWGGGIVGVQSGEGNLKVDVKNSTITSEGTAVSGIAAIHSGEGDVDFDVHGGDTDADRVKVDLTGTSENSVAIDGIFGYHLGEGESNVHVSKADITVEGDSYSNGIAYAYWAKDTKGDLTFNVEDVMIDVKGRRHLDGIFGGHRGEGNVDVTVTDAKINLEATGRNSGDSGGIAFIHDGPGYIKITAQDVDITVKGDRSVGIGGGQRYEGTGDVDINVLGSESKIEVTGNKAAGIRSFNFSGKGVINIEVGEGVEVIAKGAGSSGILVGLTGRELPGRQNTIKAPAGITLPDDLNGSNERSGVYVGQTVVVNGSVWGGSTGGAPDSDGGPSVTGAGIRLYGGGKVEIGPNGSVGADSGIAVLAEGEDALLHVVLKEHTLEDVMENYNINDKIQNEDGIITRQIENGDDVRTTIKAYGKVLLDQTDEYDQSEIRDFAPNGARDIYLKSSENTAPGRNFTLKEVKLTDDYIVIERHAPRAAVYESLPGFMLRLDQGEDRAGKRLLIPGSPMWVKVSGGQGSYEPDRSNVMGATYDFNRFETEIGTQFEPSQAQNTTGWAALRYVSGSADVSAPTGGGKIDASGFGASAGASWNNTAGYYANGSVSVTRYGTDLRADGRGRLKDGVDATIRTFGIEAGQRLSLAEHLSITPQGWFTYSDLSMGDFEDVVGAQVSLQEATQSVAGLGIVVESTRPLEGGERTLDLQGRLGVEQLLGDAEAAVEVSGERLSSKADHTRVVMGLGAVVHWDQWSLGGEVSASALGSENSHYAASLNLGKQF